MHNQSMRYLKTLFLAVALSLLGISTAWATDPVAAAADLVIMRPVGIAATAIGTGAFIASLPITYTNGTARQTSENLVMKPFRFTFTRPLGKDY